MPPFPRDIDDVNDFDKAIVVTETNYPYKIIHVNKEWEDLCGYTMDECKGKTLGMIQKEETEREVLEKLFEDLEKFSDEESRCTVALYDKDSESDALSDVFITNYKKDGSKFRNHLRIFPIFSKDGKFEYYCGLLENEDKDGDNTTKDEISNVKSYEKYYVLFAGILLSFNSGYINGCCLSGMLLPSGRTQGVSAFTGTYTKVGLSLAHGDFNDSAFQAEMILCFILGAFVSGTLNPESKTYQLGPAYGPTFIVGAICLFIASAIAMWGDHDDGAFYFAAMANGIQNGMSSMYSGNLIRSTHLTGTSTDIGLILGQMVRGNYANKWKCFVLIFLALSFWFGGFVSFFSVQQFKSTSLVFNASLFLSIGMGCIIYLMKANDITLWQAVTGNWHWDKVFDMLKLKDGSEVTTSFMLELFDSIDEDGSGEIDVDELFEAVKKTGLESISMDQVKKMVRIADTDGDGLISKDEWINLAMKKKSSKRRLL